MSQVQRSAVNARDDVRQPDFSGWMRKQSAWLKDWRRRYFVLKGDKLFYARSDEAPPHGYIDLSTCVAVKSAGFKVEKHNMLEISTRGDTFYMCAENEKQKDLWIGAIGKAIVQSSSMFTADDGLEDQGSDDDGDWANAYEFR